MASRLSSLVGSVCLAVASCGGGSSTTGDTSSTAATPSSTVDAEPGDSTTSSRRDSTTGSSSSTATSTSTSTTVTDTTGTAATTTSASSSTATGAPLSELTLTLTSGSIDADADEDLFVLGVDGDLALHPGALSSGTGGSIRLVDHPDPREPVAEGPGPNVIEDVAGVVHGSVVYGECCEPVAGTVFAVTEPEDEETPIANGYSPNISPDGGRLAMANDFMLTVVATATGSGLGLQLNQGDQSFGTYRNVRDVEWLSAEDVAILFWTDDGGYQVAVYEAESLAEVTSAPLGIERDLDLDQFVRFAGLGPDGELTVVVPGVDATHIRFFDPVVLAERSQLDRSLPSGVTSVALADDGVGLLWVDDGTVYFLDAGSLEAKPIAMDALAAWFVRSA